MFSSSKHVHFVMIYEQKMSRSDRHYTHHRQKRFFGWAKLPDCYESVGRLSVRGRFSWGSLDSVLAGDVVSIVELLALSDSFCVEQWDSCDDDDDDDEVDVDFDKFEVLKQVRCDNGWSGDDGSSSNKHLLRVSLCIFSSPIVSRFCFFPISSPPLRTESLILLTSDNFTGFTRNSSAPSSKHLVQKKMRYKMFPSVWSAYIYTCM